ncbi:28737_t:CDS:2 [Dentiscutata erythropus]|uniref:28737_t:CDS:1 n=1 Tax=Dentiscutata erythropus TaxID=1348616 RepID=A0A9N9C174_9GLOM|nr:28737_t:CDS:2 [Dentiscutata erythropus]
MADINYTNSLTLRKITKLSLQCKYSPFPASRSQDVPTKSLSLSINENNIPLLSLTAYKNTILPQTESPQHSRLKHIHLNYYQAPGQPTPNNDIYNNQPFQTSTNDISNGQFLPTPINDIHNNQPLSAPIDNIHNKRHLPKFTDTIQNNQPLPTHINDIHNNKPLPISAKDISHAQPQLRNSFAKPLIDNVPNAHFSLFDKTSSQARPFPALPIQPRSLGDEISHLVDKISSHFSAPKSPDDNTSNTFNAQPTLVGKTSIQNPTPVVQPQSPDDVQPTLVDKITSQISTFTQSPNDDSNDPNVQPTFADKTTFQIPASTIQPQPQPQLPDVGAPNPTLVDKTPSQIQPLPTPAQKFDPEKDPLLNLTPTQSSTIDPSDFFRPPEPTLQFQTTPPPFVHQPIVQNNTLTTNPQFTSIDKTSNNQPDFTSSPIDTSDDRHGYKIPSTSIDPELNPYSNTKPPQTIKTPTFNPNYQPHIPSTISPTSNNVDPPPLSANPPAIIGIIIASIIAVIVVVLIIRKTTFDLIGLQQESSSSGSGNSIFCTLKRRIFNTFGWDDSINSLTLSNRSYVDSDKGKGKTVYTEDEIGDNGIGVSSMSETEISIPDMLPYVLEDWEEYIL